MPLWVGKASELVDVGVDVEAAEGGADVEGCAAMDEDVAGNEDAAVDDVTVDGEEVPVEDTISVDEDGNAEVELFESPVRPTQ